MRRRSKTTRAHSPGGFTLLEVLMAMALFAMAAVMLASAYLNVLNSYETAGRAAQLNEDFAFARQLVLNEPDRKKVEEGGEFATAAGHRARWSVEIASTNVADVFRVAFNCEISDPVRQEPDRVTQSFLVMRPTWVIDAAERGKLKEEAKTRILELQGKLKAGQSGGQMR
jgi:general secretion pathway protein I